MDIIDFCKLSKLNMDNCDFDCIYPLVTDLANQGGWSDKDRLWYCVLYMVFYNESAALTYFHHPRRGATRLPIDTARRCLRGGRIVRHLESWKAISQGQHVADYLCNGFTDDRAANWHQLLDNIQQVYGNGRWAGYTTADLLHKVCGLPVQPTSTGWRQSSGPKNGLEKLPPNKLALDQREGHWLRRLAPLAQKHLRLAYWPEGWDYGVLESLLCDWDGLTKGGYYSGRNLDRMLNRMGKVLDVTGTSSPLLKQILESRQRVYPANQLGERHGWYAIDPKRKKHYLQTGEVLCGAEDRKSITGATSLMQFLGRHWCG